jgi:hypothetical protein
MLQQWMVWCTSQPDPEGLHFPETDYIDGIRRYLDVDADDPTRIVEGYLNGWWWVGTNAPSVPTYAFNPEQYLAGHRPQVCGMFLVFYFLSYIWLDSIHLARCTAGSVCSR